MEKELRVKAPADFHVHLRQGDMCSLVTPLVYAGGFRLAYVMVCASFHLQFKRSFQTGCHSLISRLL